MHTFSVELLRLLQLEPQIQQTERRNHTKAQGDTPNGTQVVLGEDQDDNHRNQAGQYKAQVDHKVGKDDEPAVALTLGQLPGAFGRGDGARRILTADANAQEETVRGQCSKESVLAAFVTVRTGGQSSENDEDEGGNHQRPLTRPVVTQHAEDQLAQYGAGKGYGRDILGGGRVGVGIGVEPAQDGVDGANDLYHGRLRMLIRHREKKRKKKANILSHWGSRASVRTAFR